MRLAGIIIRRYPFDVRPLALLELMLVLMPLPSLTLPPPLLLLPLLPLVFLPPEFYPVDLCSVLVKLQLVELVCNQHRSAPGNTCGRADPGRRCSHAHLRLRLHEEGCFLSGLPSTRRDQSGPPSRPLAPALCMCSNLPLVALMRSWTATVREPCMLHDFRKL